MAKVKEIVKHLENYKKIISLTNGQIGSELEQFLGILKSCQSMKLENFEKKIRGEEERRKKVSSKDEYLRIGELYFKWKNNENISNEEELLVSSFLKKLGNENILLALETNFTQTYEVINKFEDHQLTSNQLYFLGMALLNIKLKGSSKSLQKKNLLDMLWSAIESEKMNEFYREVY